MMRRSLCRWRRLGGAAALALIFPGCRPPQHVEEANPTLAETPPPLAAGTATPAPSPTAEPSPTPLYIPYKKLDTGKLFNGLQFQSSFSTEPGRNATAEAADPASYTLRMDLHVRVPKAVTAPEGLAALNPALPAVFPAFTKWIAAAKVSPLYERFYGYKLQALRQNLLHLDQLLTRHDFFDCETVLEVQPPGSPRRALWLQSDMDVDSDGSDSDRVPLTDGSSPTFQPLTSYRWPKRTATVNPFIAPREEKLAELQAALFTKAGAQRELARNQIAELKADIEQLKTDSFLVAADDPYVVMSWAVAGKKIGPFSPAVGDYCAVIYKGVIYPAIIGDIGPVNKMGEASLRIAQELNTLATAENRPESKLKVTYLVFPGTAERPFGPPDLAHWRDKVDGFLKEMGGYNGQLFAWKDLTAPSPTPTPAPSPSPSPSASPPASATPAASASPSASASTSPSPP